MISYPQIRQLDQIGIESFREKDLESRLADAKAENARLREALEKIEREANLDDAMFGVIDKIAKAALAHEAEKE